MAYYIFLKSLRSLEEFRKNPYVKIPPKSPPTNFQSLAIIKNQIFIWKRIFFFTFGPERPSGQSARPASQPGHPPRHPPPLAGRARALDPSRPARPWRNCQKPPLLRVCAARRLRLLPLSPPRGPHLLASSSPPRLTAIDRPTPPGLHHCDANPSPLLPRLDSPS
jgi:hypothetical protein